MSLIIKDKPIHEINEYEIIKKLSPKEIQEFNSKKRKKNVI